MVKAITGAKSWVSHTKLETPRSRADDMSNYVEKNERLMRDKGITNLDVWNTNEKKPSNWPWKSVTKPQNWNYIIKWNVWTLYDQYFCLLIGLNLVSPQRFCLFFHIKKIPYEPTIPRVSGLHLCICIQYLGDNRFEQEKQEVA